MSENLVKGIVKFFSPFEIPHMHKMYSLCSKSTPICLTTIDSQLYDLLFLLSPLSSVIMCMYVGPSS